MSVSPCIVGMDVSGEVADFNMRTGKEPGHHSKNDAPT